MTLDDRYFVFSKNRSDNLRIMNNTLNGSNSRWKNGNSLKPQDDGKIRMSRLGVN